MDQMLLDQLHRYAFAFDWWVAVISSLPFPIWLMLMVFGVAYIIKK